MMLRPACQPGIPHPVYGTYHYHQVSSDFTPSTTTLQEPPADPLSHAIIHNHLVELNRIINTPGFNPNATLLNQDFTPLMLAASRGLDLAVKLFLYPPSFNTPETLVHCRIRGTWPVKLHCSRPRQTATHPPSKHSSPTMLPSLSQTMTPSPHSTKHPHKTTRQSSRSLSRTEPASKQEAARQTTLLL